MDDVQLEYETSGLLSHLTKFYLSFSLPDLLYCKITFIYQVFCTVIFYRHSPDFFLFIYDRNLDCQEMFVDYKNPVLTLITLII